MKQTNQLAECAWIHKKLCQLNGKCSICPHAKKFIDIVKNGLYQVQKPFFVKQFEDYIEVWSNENGEK